MGGNFVTHWCGICKRYLRGHELDPSVISAVGDRFDVLYFDLLLRSVEAPPRVVREADTLVIPAAFNAAFEDIKRRIELGEALTPYLSKRTSKPGTRDLLLYDWGIHHLHMAPDRTKELLFARFTDDSAYLVALMDHSSWCDVELIEIILRNWPHLIEPHWLPDVVPPPADWNQQERWKLRAAGALPGVALSNGRFYAAFGGGITTSGHSLKAVRKAARFARSLRRTEKWLYDNVSELPAELGLPSEPHFELVASRTTQPSDFL